MFHRFIATLVFLGGLPLLIAAAPAANGMTRPPCPATFLPPRLRSIWKPPAVTLHGNPALIAQRQNLQVSSEAIEVAKRFPTSLNPTLSVEVCPWVFQRGPGGGIERLDNFVTVNWAQPIETGRPPGNA